MGKTTSDMMKTGKPILTTVDGKFQIIQHGDTFKVNRLADSRTGYANIGEARSLPQAEKMVGDAVSAKRTGTAGTVGGKGTVGLDVSTVRGRGIEGGSAGKVGEPAGVGIKKPGEEISAVKESKLSKDGFEKEPLKEAGKARMRGEDINESVNGINYTNDSIGQMLGVERKSPYSIEDSVKNTNPNYLKGDGYRRNCQRCVATYEMRRRGYNVIAKPRPYNNTIKRSVDCFNASLTYTMGKRDLINQLMTYPDGARFGIRQEWENAKLGVPGHTYVAEKLNGKLHFYDPQNGNFDCSSYLDRVKEGTLAYFRMDNAEFRTGLDLNIIAEGGKIP